MFNLDCSKLYIEFLIALGSPPDEGDPDREVYKNMLKVLDKLSII